MKDNIIYMGKKINKSKFVTPKQALKQALNSLDDKESVFNRCNSLIVIALDAKDNSEVYDWEYFASNLNKAQLISLLAIISAFCTKGILE